MPVGPGIGAEHVGTVITYTEEGLLLFLRCAGVLIVGLTCIVHWLAGRVDRGCPSCPHCVSRADRRARGLSENGGQQTPEQQAERLFGRRDLVGPSDEGEAPSDGTSGAPEHDAGREEEEG